MFTCLHHTVYTIQTTVDMDCLNPNVLSTSSPSPCLPVLQGQALSLDAGWVDQFNSDWEAPLLAYETENKWKSHSCVPTLCNSMDCSLSSSIHEILQARVLEWVAISFSQGSSQAGDPTQVSYIAGRFFTNSATMFSTISSIKGEVNIFLSTCQLPLFYLCKLFTFQVGESYLLGTFKHPSCKLALSQPFWEVFQESSWQTLELLPVDLLPLTPCFKAAFDSTSLYPQHLTHNLVHGSCSVNVCLMMSHWEQDMLFEGLFRSVGQ